MALTSEEGPREVLPVWLQYRGPQVRHAISAHTYPPCHSASHTPRGLSSMGEGAL